MVVHRGSRLNLLDGNACKESWDEDGAGTGFVLLRRKGSCLQGILPSPMPYLEGAYALVAVGWRESVRGLFNADHHHSLTKKNKISERKFQGAKAKNLPACQPLLLGHIYIHRDVKPPVGWWEEDQEEGL